MNRQLFALALATAMTVPWSAFADETEFSTVSVPSIDLDKRNIRSSRSVMLDGKKADMEYRTLLRSGDLPGNSELPFGTLIDGKGNRTLAEDKSVRVSNDNDYSSLVRGTQGGLFMVSHFESRPAAMYLTELRQNGDNGALAAVRTRPLDFSHLKGGRVHCAGSVSPWGSHLGSEEYPPDASPWRDKTIDGYNASMARYFGVEPQPANLAEDEIADNQAGMTEEEMAKIKQGVVLLPMTAGAVVIAYNLEGVEGLRGAAGLIR